MSAPPGNPIPPDGEIHTMGRPRGPLASVGVPDPRAFGAELAARRREAGLNRAELAAAAGLDVSSLSRLENGRRGGLSRGLLDRLAAALGGDPAGLYAAAGALPATLERELADARYARALAASGRNRTLRALRQAHLRQVAVDFYGRWTGEEGPRVDLAVLADAARLSHHVAEGSRARVSFPDHRHARIELPAAVLASPDSLPLQRFLLAHAIGHALGEARSCSYPAYGEPEADATDLAAYLLAPQGPLDRAVQAATQSFPDPWSATAAGIAAVVAARLAIPGWVAIRRLGEEGSLEAYAEESL